MEHSINLTSKEIAFLADLVDNHLNGSHEILEELAEKLNRICVNKSIQYDGSATVNHIKSRTNLDGILWVGK